MITKHLGLCNQQGEWEDRQCQTSGFNKEDHCPLSGPLHQLLKDCLSTAGPFKPPANPCQARFPLSVSGGIYNPKEWTTHQVRSVLFHRGSAHRGVETNCQGLLNLMVPYPVESDANLGSSSLQTDVTLSSYSYQREVGIRKKLKSLIRPCARSEYCYRRRDKL